MPNHPPTTPPSREHTIRVPTNVWAALETKAAQRFTTVDTVIADALAAHSGASDGSQADYQAALDHGLVDAEIDRDRHRDDVSDRIRIARALRGVFGCLPRRRGDNLWITEATTLADAALAAYSRAPIEREHAR